MFESCPSGLAPLCAPLMYPYTVPKGFQSGAEVTVASYDLKTHNHVVRDAPAWIGTHLSDSNKHENEAGQLSRESVCVTSWETCPTLRVLIESLVRLDRLTAARNRAGVGR